MTADHTPGKTHTTMKTETTRETIARLVRDKAVAECALVTLTAERDALKKAVKLWEEFDFERDNPAALVQSVLELMKEQARTVQERDAARAQVPPLIQCILDLLNSAESQWELNHEGHDWAYAVAAARKVLDDYRP